MNEPSSRRQRWRRRADDPLAESWWEHAPRERGRQRWGGRAICLEPPTERVAQLGEQLLATKQGRSHECRIWCFLRAVFAFLRVEGHVAWEMSKVELSEASKSIPT
jgi:hypothetical protein